MWLIGNNLLMNVQPECLVPSPILFQLYQEYPKNSIGNCNYFKKIYGAAFPPPPGPPSGGEKSGGPLLSPCKAEKNLIKWVYSGGGRGFPPCWRVRTRAYEKDGMAAGRRGALRSGLRRLRGAAFKTPVRRLPHIPRARPSLLDRKDMILKESRTAFLLR